MPDATKRSTSFRIDNRQPRFTAVDFLIPPGGANIVVPVRGRAVQVISVLDLNANTVPAINGTDNESVPAFDVEQYTNVAGLGTFIFAGARTIDNPAGTLGTIVGPNVFRVVLGAAVPPGTIQINVQTVNITGNPSGNPAVLSTNVINCPFPGGGPGIVNVPLPGAATMTMGIAPGLAGDATFNIPVAPGATTNYVISYYSGLIGHSPAYDIPSTWAQPATAGVIVSRTGYVHLNVQEPHKRVPPIAIPGQIAFQTEQAIPIPAAPAVIRVEQEFNQVIIETAAGVADAFDCVGIVIIEHETEQEVR